MSSSLPSVHEIRQRIETIPDEATKQCLRACYLYAARITEVIGKVTEGDKTTKPRVARGPTNKDARLDSYADHPAALFNVYTAKREGKKRIIALPLETEAWAKPLLDYYQQTEGLVFPFTRQQAWLQSREAFKDLSYPIESYTIWRNKELVKSVKQHPKPFRLHALRHLRITELIEVYGFNAFEVATFAGWTMRTSLGIGGQFDRYAHLDWQSYFPKLLKKV